MLLAHSLLYLLRGAPVVYYGDEAGIIGRGGDKEARQDLFPTQVAGGGPHPRLGAPPIGTGSSFDLARRPSGYTCGRSGALRDGHPALSTGATIVRLAQGGVLAVSRIDAEASANTWRRSTAARGGAGFGRDRVAVGATGHPCSASPPRCRARDGMLTFGAAAADAVLLRANADLPLAAPAAPTLRVADDLTISSAWALLPHSPTGTASA